MRKVLYLLNYAGKAGTERYVETLVKYLSADGLVQPFFAYNEGGLLVERLEAMGVPCRQITMRRRFDKEAAKALADLCREWDIDLIHCHYLREHYTALLAKKYNKKIRVVYTNHFVLANDFITRLSNRWMDKRQDQMIAVCNKGKEQLIANGWSAERIQVIFNAVDLEAWAGDRSESTLRSELGLPEDQFVMLCASRFADDKGHKYLIDSVKRLTELTDKPFTLVLAGDGPLLEPSKAQVKELGLEEQVKFIGFRKDIKNLYKGSDLYVNSSLHEALSFLIIEAMAAGVPAIVPSQLNVNLRGYVAYANEDEFRSLFTSRILDLVEHDHLAALARETAESTYSWDVVAQDYASAILSCMDDNLK